MTMKLRNRLSQFAGLVLCNLYFYGFYIRGIYQGGLKVLPCPGFNCHSCPSALFTCPVGALQMLSIYGVYHLPLYVLGFLGLIGSAAGRIVCGWACPFGLVQDLLHTIPSPKFRIPALVTWLRYAVLFGLVLGAAWITSDTWFCKLCPAGTLEAGIPLTALNPDLREMTGTLFSVKLGILAFFLLLFVITRRPFCRTVCPLGTIYGFFNRISFIRPRFASDKCTGCKACLKQCPVELSPHEGGACLSSQCIRCLRCLKCPAGAITLSPR
jgi:polyferredoxin